MSEFDFPELVRIVETCGVGVFELVQRMVIILADLCLIVGALVSLYQDWDHTCDQTLHLYALLCVVLCVLDLGWEIVRCSWESQLDRLQADFQQDGGISGEGAEGLLGEEMQESLGAGLATNGAPRATGVASNSQASLGPIGRGVRKEKALKQTRTRAMQLWSTVFSCFVSAMFAFFAAHDEECAETDPYLYDFIHIFTYVFMLRLAFVMMLVCMRTIKNYEDAANLAGAARQMQGVPMTTF